MEYNPVPMLGASNSSADGVTRIGSGLSRKAVISALAILTTSRGRLSGSVATATGRAIRSPHRSAGTSHSSRIARAAGRASGSRGFIGRGAPERGEEVTGPVGTDGAHRAVPQG